MNEISSFIQQQQQQQQQRAGWMLTANIRQAVSRA